ncbi:MAG TPA: hypothetical protein VJ770_23885 [Stellaceae bacterium]|nr:hypothetical protein [Stellaceae bacterium]
MSRSGLASPGGSIALWLIWTVRLTLVEHPVFSPQMAAGSTTSAISAVSVMKASCTITNTPCLRRIARSRFRSGMDTAGFVPMIHSTRMEPVSA